MYKRQNRNSRVDATARAQHCARAVAFSVPVANGPRCSPSAPCVHRRTDGELAEIGVILLMFGIGRHFSMRDLMAVRGIALPGAIGQIATATAIGVGIAH